MFIGICVNAAFGRRFLLRAKPDGSGAAADFRIGFADKK